MRVGNKPVHLLRIIENHLKQTKIAPARFGRDAVGDPRFVFDLRNGREPRKSTVTKVCRYMEIVQ